MWVCEWERQEQKQRKRKSQAVATLHLELDKDLGTDRQTAQLWPSLYLRSHRRVAVQPHLCCKLGIVACPPACLTAATCDRSAGPRSTPQSTRTHVPGGHLLALAAERSTQEATPPFPLHPQSGKTLPFPTTLTPLATRDQYQAKTSEVPAAGSISR